MGMVGGSGPRSGLSALIGALAAARTAAAVAEAVANGRQEACGADAVGLALAEPGTRLLPEPDLGPALDPLLVAELAYAAGPRFFDSPAEVRAAYPILDTVGAPVPAGACAVVPLSGPGTPTGALVAVWDRPRGFSPGERGLLSALADLCSAELARTGRLERDRHALAGLRRRLRPDWLPQVAGAELAVRHDPPVGADPGLGFYDVFETDDGAWRLVAGDTAGTGVAAATLAGLARAELRGSGAEPGPAAVLGHLDRLVRGFGDVTGRVTAVCVDLSRRGRGFTLTAARAGHPPPLVLRAATGVVLSVDVPGGPLGAWPDPAPVERGLELHPGDSVVLCAGGAGRSGDPRLPAVLAGCAGRSAADMLDHLGLALAGPSPGSLLALRVRGGRPRDLAPG
jgi:Stage II sporulation protein E (SpoIIE)